MHRDQSGQSLIIVVSAMTVLMALAGAGIDTATWMVRHHRAQVVADAAALAAAQCLAEPGQGSTMFVGGTKTTVPTCTSSTDTADAQKVAVDYAAANGLTISTSNVSVDTSNQTVTVTATAHSPGFFARFFGLNQTTQTAGAGAGWKNVPGQCTSAGQNCDFMFANSNNCSSGSSPALNVTTQGSSVINGNIQTNGSLSAATTGNSGGINGTGTFGPGSCTSAASGNHNVWLNQAPGQANSVIKWPIDYSTDFPACGGSGPACQSNGYPKWCTNVSANITFNGATGGYPVSGNIYCASGYAPGNGVNVSDPSTWTGSITISSSGNNTWADTFVAGRISYTGSGGDTISPCGYTSSGFSSSSCQGPPVPPPPAGNTANYPVFYAIGADPSYTNCQAGTNVSTSCAFSVVSTGNLTLDGDVFVQNGTAYLNLGGNQSAGNTFIEGAFIKATLFGNFNGDGPSPSGGNNLLTGGGVSLIQ